MQEVPVPQLLLDCWVIFKRVDREEAAPNVFLIQDSMGNKGLLLPACLDAGAPLGAALSQGELTFAARRFLGWHRWRQRKQLPPVGKARVEGGGAVSL